MGEEMRKILLFLVFLATVLTLNLAYAVDETVLLSPGDKFPNLAFPDQLEKQDKEYLGEHDELINTKL